MTVFIRKDVYKRQAALLAALAVKFHLSIRYGIGMHRTRCHNGTFLTSAAFFLIDSGNALANNADIVQIRLYTVVRTSAYRNLELMRQHNAAVSFVEAMMDFFREIEGIDQTEVAGGSLTTYHRANLLAGSAGRHAFLCQEGLEVLYILIGDALHFLSLIHIYKKEKP